VYRVLRVSGPLYFRKLDGALLKIDSRTASRLRRFAQREEEDTEAGGVLLGRHLRDSTDVIVDAVSEPADEDRRSKFAFFRSMLHHQGVIDRLWQRSNGTCSYLGEWHTHPEPTPSASRTDLADWRRHLRSDEVDTDSLYFVIVGQRKIRAWEGVRRTGRIVQLPDEELRSPTKVARSSRK
jgi:integrative and conjugative element protein (TIGR02256 family)